MRGGLRVTTVRRVPRRSARPRSALDLGLAGIGLVIAGVATWRSPDPVGTSVAGPLWLRVAFPFLLSLPLAWRRSAPSVCVGVVLGAVLLQALVTQNSPEGLELIFCVGTAMYAAGAYAGRDRSVLALVYGALVYVVYAVTNADIRTGRAGEVWAGAFFGVALVAVWLVGVFVRSRRAEAAATAQRVAVEDAVRHAVVDERARLARELHDVISHNLSVVVVQAAGARAGGAADAAALEKIERSGRESLVEMRRLLGVLRHDDTAPALTPQPGIGDLAALTESLRGSGLPVDLTVDGSPDGLPPALALSVFRIVQEALTNALKHAGSARVEVRVAIDETAVTVDVVDDGRGGPAETTGGHGLVGMRERVAMFDGELVAGPRPCGGFAVHARLSRTAGCA